MHISLDLVIFFIFGVLFSPINGRIEEAHPSPSLHLSPAALKSFLTRVLQRNAAMRDCPAPKFPLETNDCNLPACSIGTNCANKNLSCCFNGCIFTCVERIPPPPVIDYEYVPSNPPRRVEGDKVLRCTTSPRPAPSEVLHCPKNYMCRVDSSADYEGDLPLGICVPTLPILDPEVEDESGLKEKTRKQTVYIPDSCVLTEDQYKRMQNFKKRSYVIDCYCIDGSIVCQLQSHKE